LTIERVAVIGAGIAGLTAARRMARAGREVVVFDKARGAGGRTSTRRREEDPFDHGAQYFTCRGEPFRRQVEGWCARGVAATWDVTLRTLGKGWVGWSPETSTRYVGVPGMSALARDLAKELRLECGRRVERVECAAGNWQLVSEDGPAIEGFDAIVVATPAPQAVPLLANAPRLAALAAGIEMQPCHAVMLTFSEPLGLDFEGAFVSDAPIEWVARNTSKPGRPGGECWVLHSSREWSKENLEASPDAVAASLQALFGEVLDRELPAASHRAAHRWLLARAREPLHVPMLWDEKLRVGVCGDWMLGDRVEDAFVSGDALARAMLG
jgi:renalase